MKKDLNTISERTLKLWYEVNKKYGDHVYTLGVNGLGQVVLSKGFGADIAIGNGEVQKMLKSLLA